MMDKTAKVMSDRAPVHGEFVENSRATWEMLRAMQRERNWPILPDPQKHALYMIAHKMARILAGDPSHEDHWDDIAGYARCVADRLRTPVRPYDGQEAYAALAVGWNCTREEALHKMQAMYGKRKADVPPAVAHNGGTPENGGHHSAASEADAGLDDAVRAVRQELNRGI